MERAVIESKLPMNGIMKRTHAFGKKEEAVEVSVRVEWDLGVAGMLLGEQKVRDILDQSFSATLLNWKERAEKITG
jgi:hypothetical protein